MKRSVTKILCLLLALVLTVTVFAACKKEEAPDTPPEESTEAPKGNEDNKSNDSKYKETFYLKDDRYDCWYSMKLTDTTAYLEWGEGPDGYAEGRIFTECPYYIDADGNYVLDVLTLGIEYLYFGVSSGKITGEENESMPLVFRKVADYMYCADDICVMKLGQTTEKFIWLGGNDNEFFEQNSQAPEEMEFYYVDGKTGETEFVTVGMDQVVMPDLTTVGDATIQITYDGKTHDVACYVYPENEGYGDCYHSYEDQYEYLERRRNSLASYVTQGMTYEEYFATYTGAEPLFYYEIKNTETQTWEEIPITEYTVEFWDSSLASGSNMIYRVSYEHEGVTYRYTDSVVVLAQADLGKGDIRLSKLKQDGTALSRTGGVLYLAKGSTLEGLTCDITPYEGDAIPGAAVSVSGYDANKTGIQMVSLTSENAVGTATLPVYVYDPAAPILAEVDFDHDNWVYDANGSTDYTQSYVIHTYSDGSTQKIALNDVRDSLISTPNERDNTLWIRYRATVTVDGNTYTLRTGSRNAGTIPDDPA